MLNQSAPDSGSNLDQTAKDRLTYASYYLDQAKLVYVETPKAACSAFKHSIAALADHDMRKSWRSDMALKTRTMTIHDRSLMDIPNLGEQSEQKFARIVTSRDILRFCIVRNPFARIASAWTDRFLCHTLSPLAPIMQHLDFPEYRADWSFLREQFTLFVDHIYCHEQTAISNHHWQTLEQLLLPSSLQYTHIIKLENLSEELNPVITHIENCGMCWPGLPKINETPLSLGTRLYTQATAAKIREIYASDFSTFSYSDALEISKPSALPTLPDAQWVKAIQDSNRRNSDLSLMHRGLL